MRQTFVIRLYEDNKAHRRIAGLDKNHTCFVVRGAIPFVELVAQTKGLSPRPIRQFLPCSADELQFHGCYTKFEVVKILLRNLEFGSCGQRVGGDPMRRPDGHRRTRRHFHSWISIVHYHQDQRCTKVIIHSTNDPRRVTSQSLIHPQPLLANHEKS